MSTVADKTSQVPEQAEEVVISGGNHTIALEGGAHEIYCGGAGILVARMAKDEDFFTYKGVPAGGVVSGHFVEVSDDSTTTFMVARR